MVFSRHTCEYITPLRLGFYGGRAQSIWKIGWLRPALFPYPRRSPVTPPNKVLGSRPAHHSSAARSSCIAAFAPPPRRAAALCASLCATPCRSASGRLRAVYAACPRPLGRRWGSAPDPLNACAYARARIPVLAFYICVRRLNP